MATTLLLVRHGLTAAVGHALAGRADEPGLGDEGWAQAQRLADWLHGVQPSAVYTSPIRRAVQTAECIAARLQQRAQARPALTEVDFGAWTGRRFEALDDVERWRRFNTFRSGTAPPGGEPMSTVQARVVGELLGLRDAHPDATVVVVSHADPIRSALAHFLGVPLDLMLRLSVDPASTSALELGDWGATLRFLNRAA
ncbi:MAG TPA: histidine phosphatase family protein [Polyangiaceae bacterium]|nr:histidine phosphatase family protein [Polyangiaceae bacterium]